MKEKYNKLNVTHNSIFNNPEFDNRFDRLMASIKKYLIEANYDLVNLEIDEIIGWHDWGTERKIYVSDKCPLDIKTQITDLIKKEFSNPEK
ncbi:hypothetical protein [Litoribaculum gwangyangense]|uniref:hypothetical protein n=1 Tax=Litoribaculum gwangyangense TaxID=1130722 RepID=UPI0031EBB4FF